MPPSLIEIRSDASRRVIVRAWTDALLRSRCACAQCRHARRNAQYAIADEVTIDDIEPCGANAVKLVFSDAHSRGIFPFDYLRELAQAYGPGVMSCR